MPVHANFYLVLLPLWRTVLCRLLWAAAFVVWAYCAPLLSCHLCEDILGTSLHSFVSIEQRFVIELQHYSHQSHRHCEGEPPPPHLFFSIVFQRMGTAWVRCYPNYLSPHQGTCSIKKICCACIQSALPYLEFLETCNCMWYKHYILLKSCPESREEFAHWPRIRLWVFVAIQPSARNTSYCLCWPSNVSSIRQNFHFFAQVR